MIRIPKGLRRVLCAQAERAYPEECCGLLVGQKHADGAIKVTRIEPSPNVSREERRTSFEVDPAVRFRIMRQLEGGDELLIGHYHSHPDQRPEPSARDLECAFEPELIWLIIAVEAGRAAGLAAFRLDPSAAEPACAIPIAILDRE